MSVILVPHIYHSRIKPLLAFCYSDHHQCNDPLPSVFPKVFAWVGGLSSNSRSYVCLLWLTDTIVTIFISCRYETYRSSWLYGYTLWYCGLGERKKKVKNPIKRFIWHTLGTRYWPMTTCTMPLFSHSFLLFVTWNNYSVQDLIVCGKPRTSGGRKSTLSTMCSI